MSKPDPTLEKFTCQIGYTASDKYRMSMDFKSGIKTAPKPATPMQTIQEAAREFARIAALFGHQKEFQAATDEAFKAVAEWRSKKEAS